MKQRPKYMTKQRRAVLSCLEKSGVQHMTAEQVAAYCGRENAGIGLTTVYRQLDNLVKEGAVRKYTIEGDAGAYYELVPGSPPHLYHVKCNQCGELSHLDCETLDAFATHVLSDHDFKIDLPKTVFYGTCKACMQGK